MMRPTREYDYHSGTIKTRVNLNRSKLKKTKTKDWSGQARY